MKYDNDWFIKEHARSLSAAADTAMETVIREILSDEDNYALGEILRDPDVAGAADRLKSILSGYGVEIIITGKAPSTPWCTEWAIPDRVVTLEGKEYARIRVSREGVTIIKGEDDENN